MEHLYSHISLPIWHSHSTLSTSCKSTPPGQQMLSHDHVSHRASPGILCTARLHATYRDYKRIYHKLTRPPMLRLHHIVPGGSIPLPPRTPTSIALFATIIKISPMSPSKYSLPSSMRRRCDTLYPLRSDARRANLIKPPNHLQSKNGPSFLDIVSHAVPDLPSSSWL